MGSIISFAKCTLIWHISGLLVEIIGIESLLFVCLKGSQGKEKIPTLRLVLVEIIGIEPLTS